MFALSHIIFYIYPLQQIKQTNTKDSGRRLWSGGRVCIGLHPPTHCLVEQCNCGVNNVGGGQPSGWWAEFSIGASNKENRKLPVANFGTRVSPVINSMLDSPNLFLLPPALLEVRLGVITSPSAFLYASPSPLNLPLIVSAFRRCWTPSRLVLLGTPYNYL